MYAQLSERFVKATRKPHRCDWCGEILPPGSQANNDAHVFDGAFHSRYLHPECFDAMRATDWHGLGEDTYDPGCQKRGQPMTEDDDA